MLELKQSMRLETRLSINGALSRSSPGPLVHGRNLLNVISFFNLKCDIYSRGSHGTRGFRQRNIVFLGDLLEAENGSAGN